jgi:hypothetical protein
MTERNGESTKSLRIDEIQKVPGMNDFFTTAAGLRPVWAEGLHVIREKICENHKRKD